MEQRNLGYSLKNIPIPSNDSYMKIMMEKVGKFIRNMRWKAFRFENPEAFGAQKETYGFKSNAAPPKMEHLNAFETDLYEIISNIQFSKRRDPFQRKLSKDAKEIASSPNVLVSADKTTNLYSMDKDTYEKLLHENVTRAYEKADGNLVESINLEARKISAELELADRMEVFAQRDSYITLKDHKDNFVARPQCRLINPAKSDVGIVSRQILQAKNKEIRTSTGLNQWRRTSSVIEWFTNLVRKTKLKFIKFDVVEFYRSITETLLTNSITWAKTKTTISQEDEAIIMHARKSLLFSEGDTWTKQNGELFDVTMGSYDGAEVCELVGLFLLDEMAALIPPEAMGLYRDDGLAAVEMSGPQCDKTRKLIHKLFEKHGLKVTIETNLQKTDFLDVVLDLQTGRYSPYRKPNDTPLYISVHSNHPQTIINHLPASINRRVSNLSYGEDEFNRAKPIYEEALKSSGYESTMAYKENPPPRRRTRSRNIVWFNPPFSKHVTTDVARLTLKLVDKHFPPHHRYSKLFNRNNVKVSYSCVDNMQRIIKKHNAKILSQPLAVQDAVPPCNCKRKQSCPLNGMCQVRNIVYQATVTATNLPTKYYYGLTERRFKDRFYEHTADAKHKSHRNNTRLSVYVWELKERGVDYNITWSIKKRASSYQRSSGRCDLCLAEKMVIATADKNSMLNSRSEIVSACRHRHKYKLGSFKAAIDT